MRDAGFLLFGCQVFTDLSTLDHAAKVNKEQEEAAMHAVHQLAVKRLMARILIITSTQVVALPDLAYDLLDNVAVVDLHNTCFLHRDNRRR